MLNRLAFTANLAGRAERRQREKNELVAYSLAPMPETRCINKTIYSSTWFLFFSFSHSLLERNTEAANKRAYANQAKQHCGQMICDIRELSSTKRSAMSNVYRIHFVHRISHISHSVCLTQFMCVATSDFVVVLVCGAFFAIRLCSIIMM